jgi:hypothetical protein
MAGRNDRPSGADKRMSFDASRELTCRTDKRTKDETEYLAELPEVRDLTIGSEGPMYDSR